MAIVNGPEDIDGDYLLSTANFRQDDDGGTLAYLTFVDPKAQGGKAAGAKSDGAYDPGGALEEEGEA